MAPLNPAQPGQTLSRNTMDQQYQPQKFDKERFRIANREIQGPDSQYQPRGSDELFTKIRHSDFEQRVPAISQPIFLDETDEDLMNEIVEICTR
ncbi:hypothetical protein BASA81_018596 [Batrachochytrium salamandrivorans]|nr:hypothetical protein BASA81_018596 [Batrachochytrium salamandrivorans]